MALWDREFAIVETHANPFHWQITGVGETGDGRTILLTFDLREGAEDHIEKYFEPHKRGELVVARIGELNGIKWYTPDDVIDHKDVV